MKKLLVALMALTLICGSAMAVEFETKGMYYVRGSYINNDTGVHPDPEPYMYYDHELDMDVKMVVSDSTFVFTNFEIHDESWIQYSGSTPSDADDNIHLKRVYGSHTFATGTQVDFGLMTGEAWATEWNDNADGDYRVKIMHPFGDHKAYFVVQKDREWGTSRIDIKDADADDNNTYLVGLDAKLGEISFRPAVTYRTIGSIPYDYYLSADPDKTVVGNAIIFDGDVDGTMTELALGVEGEMGTIGFEGELAYETTAYDSPDTFRLVEAGPEYDVVDKEDSSLYGAYFKGWMDMGAGKIGGLLAYGSYDDDAEVGFGFGEDFTPTGLGANWYPIGENEEDLYEYNAVTLLWLFGEFEVSEAMTLDGGLGYWMSNSKDNVWEDANGYEVNARMAYKVTDAVVYSIGAQWGQINFDVEGEEDPDPATRLYHRLQINF